MNSRLSQIAAEIRKDVVQMHQRGTNVGSAMSVVDILTALYFEVMRVSAPDDPLRDRCILSKGHAVSALYSALAHRGFFPRALLETYARDGSALTGHPSRPGPPGVDAATGSLGHGLPIAAGIALAARNDGNDFRVYVIMGDGELQEGSVWEGAILASALKLDRIVVIIDANDLQGYGRVSERMPRDSIAARWRSFGWSAVDVNGHDMDRLVTTLSRMPLEPGKPSVIVAHTIKGKGVSEMEDQLGWHYFSVPPEKLDAFLDELDREP